ncbi:MAG: PQQ-binding-like beta-propeller repeat protein [Bacteroidales bacterium]|nr:PQQ-binding-like beta-propeller repeat protein [Bacteroidales bacterium]
MKKILITLAGLFIILWGYTQDDMPMVWEKNLDHKIDYNGTGTEERGISFAASDKEITVFSNETGQIVWTGRYKDLTPTLNKVDELIPFWESNTIFLFDRKMGKDQIACLSLDDGSLLWTTSKYQDVSEDVVIYIPEEDAFAISLKKELVFIRVRNGEEIWSTEKFKGVVGKYVYMPDGHLVTVNFVPGGLAAFFTLYKNQIAKINVKNGDIVWENTYVGRAEKKVISKEFVYDLEVNDNKVILRLNGIQTYDYNTGASLWSAAFDYTPDIVGSPQGARRFGVYGAVADPVRVGDDLYVLDVSNKKSQYLKKYDYNSGRLIWTSPEIKGARAIPGMSIVEDKVILQIGGAVEAQAYIYRTQRNPDGSTTTIQEWKIWFPMIKPFGVQAFHTKDGSLAWESEKFKKGITNGIQIGKTIIISSGKSLYSLDIQTGADLFEVPVSKGGVGNASLILPFKEMVVVIGEKGISTFNASNGELVNSGKYKASSLEDYFDNFVIMKTDKADIACFDLNTCQYLEFKAKTGATTTMSTDGKYVYVYETKMVTKVKTSK